MNEPQKGSSRVATEAADWYARLRSDDMTQMDALRFRAWIAGDSARRREFNAIDEFWSDLSTIEQSPEVLRICASIAERRRHLRRFRRGPWALAAAVVLALTSTIWIWQAERAPRYVTAIGEQRTVPLSDGSIVTLNTATKIKLHYSKDHRGIELIHGQANFEVAKDAHRPFTVKAGQSEVRALGTSFDVYKGADTVTVTLIEGKVAVSSPSILNPSPNSSPPAPLHPMERVATQSTGEGSQSRIRNTQEIILAAGQQLTITAEAVVLPKAADVPRVTAWRARQLDFKDTPLIEAIAEANRYSKDQILLQAPGLKDARISGTFETGKNDVFAEGLQSYFGFTVTRNGHQILLDTPPR